MFDAAADNMRQGRRKNRPSPAAYHTMGACSFAVSANWSRLQPDGWSRGGQGTCGCPWRTARKLSLDMPIPNEQDMRLDPRVAREDAWRISPQATARSQAAGRATPHQDKHRSGQLVPSKAQAPSFLSSPPFPPSPFQICQSEFRNFIETSETA